MEATKENKIWALRSIQRLSCLPFFPQKDEGVEAIRDMFLEMIPSTEAGEYLIKKLLKTEKQSPSPARMREVLSYKYKPADEGPRSDML